MAGLDGRRTDMRVLQVMAGAEDGGAETFFVTLVSALARAGLDQRAAIRTHPTRAAALREAAVPTLELPFGGPLDRATGRALRAEVAGFRPDVVLTWMSRASDKMPAGDFVQAARLGGYYDMKYFRGCDHLFCITHGLVEHCVAGGFPRERVHYMPNFANLRSEGRVVRADFATPEDAQLLLALGRLHRAKAFDMLLQALTLERRPWLWIAGDGPLREGLPALAERLGVADRVRFLGWREDRGALLEAADICVFPSRYEPFGTVSLEAWAARRPLVAAAAAGPAELVRPELDALLVPTDDAPALAGAIGRVIDDPDLRDRLVESAWARYQEEFTEAACIRRYLETFERVLAEKGKA